MPSAPSSRPASGNLFANVPDAASDELFTQIASGGSTRIERIVSTGHTTPEGEWCAQERDEWVLVLKGRATLKFEDGDTTLDMAPGDHVLIPAHCRHAVVWTDEDEPTLWLAVHFEAAGTSR